MLNKFSKRGQGLPLNVIIIAMISLVVLVILILIFTGRIALFERGLGGEAEQELQTMKATYGECHPNAAVEREFLSAYKEAGEDESAQSEAITLLQSAVGTCDNFNTETDCVSSGNKCAW